MQEKEPILKVEDLHFTYNGEKTALNGVDLNIYEGEKIAVLGSNGAGKSTFFLNINGVLKSHHGDIYYRGEKITKKNLNDMNISEFKDRPPHYLSGGEKKRVSIADIIAMESEVIIFDEPTAALDPLNAAMLEEVLQKMGDEGRTMLISTHDVDFAYRWAERVIVFCHGKIIADDTPLAVFKQEDILKQANLKHPMMFDVYDILKEKGIVPDGDVYPKNIAEFQAMVKGL